MQYIQLVDFPKYEINQSGQVRNIKTQRILKPCDNGQQIQDYQFVKLNGKKQYLHRLVCKAFLGNDYNLPCVDHKNHIKTDNRLENLRYISVADNLKNRKFKNYIYVDQLPEDSQQFGISNYDQYYYSKSQNQIYFKNDLLIQQLRSKNNLVKVRGKDKDYELIELE
ncbi:HNH_endonuclease [Hexamita inflata]|uniref:HNH endonuclease n=1 Tax=Hexamita inflata TaxID=28002 RepID=A0AA86R1X7_9EUKA|nr:HNH endonuclease [Hexamita inflata]CAI9964159.1 HNH endonuclease [Hexamita inflata]